MLRCKGERRHNFKLRTFFREWKIEVGSWKFCAIISWVAKSIWLHETICKEFEILRKDCLTRVLIKQQWCGAKKIDLRKSMDVFSKNRVLENFFKIVRMLDNTTEWKTFEMKWGWGRNFLVQLVLKFGIMRRHCWYMNASEVFLCKVWNFSAYRFTAQVIIAQKFWFTPAECFIFWKVRRATLKRVIEITL